MINRYKFVLTEELRRERHRVTQYDNKETTRCENGTTGAPVVNNPDHKGRGFFVVPPDYR